MKRRWHKVRPVWVPKSLKVEKPTSEYIREWAKYTPDRIALSFYGRDITYRELDTMIDKAAWGLVGLGIKKGDRVAIDMENCPQFVIAYFAAQRAGGVAVPLNPMFKHAELEYELNDAGAETLIGLDYLYAEAQKVRSRTPLKNVLLTSLGDFLPSEPIFPLPETKEKTHRYSDTLAFLEVIEKSQDRPICKVKDLRRDLALLQYTGGTTGIPKGAMISHYALASASVGEMYWYHHREDDVFLGVAPFFHVMGQITQMCSALVCGGRIAILTRFVQNVVAQAIMHYRCTHLVGPATMMIALLDSRSIRKYDFTSVRCMVTGAASISVELQRELKEIAPKAVTVEGYGLSETVAQGGACTPLYRHKPGFVGTPQTNTEIRIVDQQTEIREMAPNEEGAIIIKSAAMMLGYWNKPDETKEVLRNGWLHTGDVGLMDEEGYLKVLGRTKELIKCSGFSVFPAEVEGLLYRHPAVKEAAVIGVSDPYRGESPKAYIVLKEGYADKTTEAEILDWCKDNMAAYKRPRFLEFREQLPKSAAGKLLRRVLAEEEQKKSRD